MRNYSRTNETDFKSTLIMTARCGVSGVVPLICNRIETDGGSSVSQVPWVLILRCIISVVFCVN